MLFLCFNESVVQGKCLSDFFVFSVPIWSHHVLSVFLLTVLIVFPALAGFVTPLFSCIINHLHFWICRTLPCSQASWQSILMFAAVHWLPNSLTAPWQQHSRTSPSSICFWSELCGADFWGTARHFSASMAANLQIAPCRPKLMEGQFGRAKGLSLVPL